MVNPYLVKGLDILGKRNYYLVLDTETATLPFVNQYGKSEAIRKKIAIAKPLVYDIGWQVIDTQGKVYKQRNFLIQETFFVPSVFDTAYYRDKRPKYIEMMEKGEIEVACWYQAINQLLCDCENVKAVCAYNAAFDFKKAIPFTEAYIYALYHNYQAFEDKQKESIQRILSGPSKDTNPEFLSPVFKLRGEEFPIIDLWEIACDRLLNNRAYKKYCLSHGLWTNSVQYFKSSAESSYQYLMKNHAFEESHTALDDARIESEILVKALKKGKVEPCMGCFPFRNLGNTFEFAEKHAKKQLEPLADALSEYIETLDETSVYCKKMLNQLRKLEAKILYENA
jgi:hypothetical protein